MNKIGGNGRGTIAGEACLKSSSDSTVVVEKVVVNSSEKDFY